jgi:hypothetical protein
MFTEIIQGNSTKTATLPKNLDLNITNVALQVTKTTTKNVVSFSIDNEDVNTIICTLDVKHPQYNTLVHIDEESRLTFKNDGPSIVHLIGYLYNHDKTDVDEETDEDESENEETEEDESEIEETEEDEIKIEESNSVPDESVLFSLKTYQYSCVLM